MVGKNAQVTIVESFAGSGNYFTNRVEAFDVEMDNSSSELIDYFLKRRNMVRK